MTSFNEWLESQGLAPIGETTTQNYFSKHYTNWLNEVFNSDEVRSYLLDTQEIALDATLVVKLNQNTEDGTPYFEVDGVAYFDALAEFFGERESVNVVTGKTSQERWYSDLFNFVNAEPVNEAPTDIQLSIEASFAASLQGTNDGVNGMSATEAGAAIATLIAVDADEDDTHTFSILDETSIFEIEGNSLKLKAGETLAEGDGEVSVTIQATDSADNTYVETFVFLNGTFRLHPQNGNNQGVADELTAGEEDTVILGFRSADTLTGGAGDDALFGSSGNDTLIGGAGNDTLWGGIGNDVFAWKLGDEGSAEAPAVDTIMDWTLGANIIDLKGLLQDADRTDLDALLDFNFADGNTVIDVRLESGADVVQQIVLHNVDLTSGGTLSDADILSNFGTQLIVE